MNHPWENLILEKAIQREPSPFADALVIWIPGDIDTSRQQWVRVATVPGAKPVAYGVYRVVPATALTVQQRQEGLLRRALNGLHSETNDRVWILPNGCTAIQCGERRTDLLLVWAENGEPQQHNVESKWPDKSVQRIGPNVFVLTSSENGDPSGIGPDSRRQAEELLAAARMQNDRQREAWALADLGVACLRDGDTQQAISHLQGALRLGKEREDRRFQGDVLGSLGLALLAVGQVGCALQLLDQALTLARFESDRVAEKTALANLGYAFSYLSNPTGAITHYEAALALARELGDRQHEADSLWCIGVQKAELGGRDEAVASAQAALEVFRNLASPHVSSLESHLRRYRDEAGAPTALQIDQQYKDASSASASIVASMWTSQAASPSVQVEGPSLLRRAFNATKSLAQFIGSGFKTASQEMRRRRLDICAPCEHHTGMRCRVCGCFTNLKTRLSHEQCPLGKWSAAHTPGVTER